MKKFPENYRIESFRNPGHCALVIQQLLSDIFNSVDSRKIRKTLRDFIKSSADYYFDFNDFELTDDDIPF